MTHYFPYIPHIPLTVFKEKASYNATLFAHDKPIRAGYEK